MRSVRTPCCHPGLAWPPRLLLPLLLVAILGLSACSLPRTYDTVLVLADLTAGERPSRLKETTATPQRIELRYSIESRARLADLYRPGTGVPRAGLVLVPGAVAQGHREPLLVAFAHTLARAGFAVVVPEMAGFAQLQMHPRNAREVADAFAWLVAQPELAPGGRAGMVGVSYALGPALLAAIEPDIHERVRFILGIGGYYDLSATLRFVTTGWFEKAGQWYTLKAHPYGQMVLVKSAIPYLADPNDRLLLAAMADRRIRDRAAALDDLVARLGLEGRAVHAFITNRDPTRFDALFAALPASMRQDLEGLDVSRQDLGRLGARLILVHGRRDRLIPYTESQALAAAVRPQQAELFLINHALGHVDLSLGHVLSQRFWAEELPDAWRLGRATYLLLAERSA